MNIDCRQVPSEEGVMNGGGTAVPAAAKSGRAWRAAHIVQPAPTDPDRRRCRRAATFWPNEPKVRSPPNEVAGRRPASWPNEPNAGRSGQRDALWPNEPDPASAAGSILAKRTQGAKS